MADVTVQQLAETVRTSLDRLLSQMKQAGLSHASGEDFVTEEDKQHLLTYLKKTYQDPNVPASVNLELLVTKIQKQLAPNSRVEHDVDLMTIDGKRTRQIDVLVRDKIGQYEFLIAIDCKDYSRKVDVTGVDAFHGLVTDVGAHRGVLVSPKGFTSGAKDRARQYCIDLYSPVDTDPHKWQVEPTAPCVVDERSAAISIRFSSSDPIGFVLPYNFVEESSVYDEHGNLIGKIMETAFRNWYEGRYPSEPGVHENQRIFMDNEVTKMDVDGGRSGHFNAELTASIHVTQKLFYGQAKISKVSGFLDHLTEGVIANAFETFLDFEEVEKEWQVLDSLEDAPVKPLFVCTGLVSHITD